MRGQLLLTALALAAGVANASNGSFYLGAGATSSHVSPDKQAGVADIFPNMSSTSWQVFAGYRPIHLFAVEADYVDLGSQANSIFTPMECVDFGSCAIGRKTDAKALAGYAVGFLPIPVPYLDVYGKAGVARFELNDAISYYNGSGVPTYSSNLSENETAFTWGAGLQAHAGHFGGRLEYEGFSKASTSVFSLSVFVDLW